MDHQTAMVLAIIIVAAFYVGRALWPTRTGQPRCGSCPQNRHRVDDYA